MKFAPGRNRAAAPVALPGLLRDGDEEPGIGEGRRSAPTFLVRLVQRQIQQRNHLTRAGINQRYL